ncbi:unnamed protein product [Rhodiola kirilowii]
MSPSRRSSMISLQTEGDLKREMKARVISCLNRLSDRDTLAAAANELETIARGLSQDSFATFLTCIHTTDSEEKSVVRRQCVRVFGLLTEAHGDDLAPHLVKMIGTVVRRLRDSDSAVRLACVETVAVMASRITKPPFAAFFKSFMDVITGKQDYNSQIGAAMCLAAAIEAAPNPDPAQLAKAVPKLLKLAKSECFKAKPALVSLLGSILGAGGCSNHGVLDSVVSCAIEFLSSADWAARKSAVEVLERLIVTDMEMAVEYRKTCVATLESRRFDKVKVVREAMNQTLKLWKEVGIDADELSPSSETQSQSSSRDTISAGCFPLKSPTISSRNAKNETPKSMKSVLPKRSPPSSNLSGARIGKPSPVRKNGGKSNITMPPKFNGHNDWKVEVDVPSTETSKVVWDEKLEEVESEVVKHVGNDQKADPRLEFKSLPLDRSRNNDEARKPRGLTAGSRVFPVLEDDKSDRHFSENFSSDDTCGDNEAEGLSIVQQQLIHIKSQQSNLLDLLHRFMGSSQHGMSALESRVQGLETALDEISHDLAMSNGKMSSSETCCKLPGADFLSPKFWRRSEGRYLNSNMNSPDSIRSTASRSRHIPFRDEHSDTHKLNHDQRFQPQDFRGNAWDGMDLSGQAQKYYQGVQGTDSKLQKVQRVFSW